MSLARATRVTVVLAALAVAACGNGTGSPASVTAPSTLPDTSSVPSTVHTSTTAPSPSTDHEAEPAGDLLDPWSAADIDWELVGPGWLLFTYAVPDALGDPEAELDGTLMLLDPANQTYEVGQLPGPYALSHAVQDLSADGRTALTASYGDEATSYSLLDLPTMASTPISTNREATHVQFGNDDRSLLVEERFTTPEPAGGSILNRITLSRAALDGTGSRQLLDLPLSPEQLPLSGYFSHVELDSGEFATTEVGAAWLRSSDGQLIRQLQAPSDRCTLVKQWSDGMILARCPDTSVDAGCWTNGLFLIPTSGEPWVEFAMPDGEFSCFAGYSDAIVLDDRVALQRIQGEGECTQQIELTEGATVSTWTPESDTPCNVTLLGGRDGAWLAHVGPLHGTFGSQYQGPGVLYEIDPLGHGSPLTPTTLVSSWNSPGVLAHVQILGS